MRIDLRLSSSLHFSFFSASYIFRRHFKCVVVYLCLHYYCYCRLFYAFQLVTRSFSVGYVCNGVINNVTISWFNQKSMGSFECQKVEHFATNAKNIIEKSKHAYFRAIVFWCFIQFQFYIYMVCLRSSTIYVWYAHFKLSKSPELKIKRVSVENF